MIVKTLSRNPFLLSGRYILLYPCQGCPTSFPSSLQITRANDKVPTSYTQDTGHTNYLLSTEVVNSLFCLHPPLKLQTVSSREGKSKKGAQAAAGYTQARVCSVLTWINLQHELSKSISFPSSIQDSKQLPSVRQTQTGPSLFQARTRSNAATVFAVDSSPEYNTQKKQLLTPAKEAKRYSYASKTWY